jgi:molybdate transport system substrate-binding protein
MQSHMRHPFVRALVLLPALLLSLGATGAVQAQAPLVAAAADLKFALEEIRGLFVKDTGDAVTLVYGSSGNFARQIRQGAPFQLFLSADEQFVLDLQRDGIARDAGALYAVGRIGIVVPHGSALKADGSLDDLKTALSDGRLKRFAIANPEHAPYGRRAEEALRHRGLWQPLQGRLVFGENVAQAAQFATSGSAQGGIIAYSLALAPEVAKLGEFALIPADWHEPLRQRMALMRSAGPVAERFYRYLQKPGARAVFRRYGFLLPGEAG